MGVRFGAEKRWRPDPPKDAPAALLVAAAAVDQGLYRLVRGGGALDLALGETLRDLGIGDRLLVLGRSGVDSYAVEDLGISASHAAFLVRAAKLLEDRPLLRRAVQCDAISLRKAAMVAAVAAGESETAWTWAAMNHTESELLAMVEKAGFAPPEIDFETESRMWFMNQDQQNRFDRGVAVAQVLVGFGLSRWKAIEAMAMNALANLAEFAPEEEPAEEKPSHEEREKAKEVYEKWVRAWAYNAGAVSGRLQAIEEAKGRVDESYDPVEVPKEVRRAAKILHDRAKRLASARRDREEGIGRLAADAVDLDVPKLLGYGTLDVYCAERLGIGVRTFRQHVWLERKMREMPEIREKLRAGEINLTKARAIAKAANPRNVKERIEAAKRTTTVETERKSQEKEDADNRKRGVRREWGPSEVMKTLRMAVEAVIAEAKSRGEEIDGGEAMARIGEMMVEDHEEELRRLLAKVKPERWEIMILFSGMCAVPGCRRPAKHIHHIKYRSRGGGEATTNKIPACERCHLGGIHRGYAEFVGSRGERLVWRVRYGDAVPIEDWEIGFEGQAHRAAGGESEIDPATAWPEIWCRDFAPDEQVEDEGHSGGDGGGESETGAGAFGHGWVHEPRVAYGTPRVPLRLRGVAR